MNIYQRLDLDAQIQVEKETFGHLAPERDKEYSGKIVFASSCYHSFGIVPISCNFDKLPDSPWLFSVIQDLGETAPKKIKQEGSVFEWHGTMKNYKFTGYFIQVYKF